MRFTTVVTIMLGVAWSSGSQPVRAQPAGCDSLVGVWEYVQPSRPGRGVIAKLGDKYTFAAVQTPQNTAVAGRGASTDAEKAAAYSASAAGVWEYSCEGSNGKYRWKMRALYSLRPEEVGSERTLEMEVQGDAAKWWFLDADGKRGNPGAAKHLK